MSTVPAPWARRLLLAAWSAFAGYLAVVGYLANRVRRLGSVDAPFADSIWDQRVEVLSFAALPQQMVILLVAGALAVAAAVAASTSETPPGPWLSTLLTAIVVAAAAATLAAVASLWFVFTGDPPDPDRAGDAYLRLGGIAMAAGAALLARTAQSSPVSPRT
jgi:hypothetical protein